MRRGKRLVEAIAIARFEQKRIKLESKSPSYVAIYILAVSMTKWIFNENFSLNFQLIFVILSFFDFLLFPSPLFLSFMLPPNCSQHPLLRPKFIGAILAEDMSLR